jgi:UDP-glucose 4-epimerase
MSRSSGLRRQYGMNQIVITGSTGVIGHRAIRELVAAGHRVTGVTRSARGRDRLELLGAGAVEADVFDEESLGRAFDGADTVINLLTHIPPAARMTDPAAWAENDRVRTEASAAIARAAQAAGVQRLVQESIAFVYADGGDAWLDEESPVAGGGVTTTALTAERNARELFGGDTVVLRFGLFIGPDSGSTMATLQAARSGASIAIGPPGAYRPTLWLDDAATAIAAALRAPAGTYNVADADPPTNAEIDAALATAVGLEALRPRPRQDGPLARSQRVSTRRLREATGWEPRVRAGTEGWGRIAGVGSASNGGGAHPAGGPAVARTGEAKVWWLGGLMAIKARAENTGGALGVLEGHALPKGYGPGLHVHSREDEIMYVIEGQIRLRVGDDDVVAGPGDWVWQPRGVPHAFRVESDSARALIMFSPGGLERMFVEGGAPAGESPDSLEQLQPDPDTMAAFGKQFGFEFVGPQLA